MAELRLIGVGGFGFHEVDEPSFFVLGQQRELPDDSFQDLDVIVGIRRLAQRNA